MAQSQVFISLAGGVGDIIHEDFGSPICVNSLETAVQIKGVIEQAQKVVREWINKGHARAGLVRVRSTRDPLPPAGHLGWHTRNPQGNPRLF